LAEDETAMLLILIPLAWLSIVAMLVMLCLTAARADTPAAAIGTDYAGSIGERLVLGEDPPLPTLAARRSFPEAARRRQAAPPLTPPRPAPRRRRIAAHGIH
jgi:hypothetical protein